MNDADLLRGTLPLAVLAALRGGESYGYEVLSRVRATGLDSVGDASVYGCLKRLEKDRILESRLVASPSGPARRYYRVTDQGEAAHHALIAHWRRFRDALDSLIDQDLS